MGLKKSGIYIVGGLLILLAITGRLNWIVPAVGALIAIVARSLPNLLRLAPVLHRIWQLFNTAGPAVGPSQNSQSKVEARFVRMKLDHDSGEIDGEILEGRFEGKHLNDLSMQQIIQLFNECAENDGESASLVEAYLDRVFGADWRSDNNNQDYQGGSGSNQGASMTKEEARQILGLQSDASQNEIKDAHRRLIQKFHPDRGGSDYLAAKINRAKDILLGA